jgi:hypothetical protein
VDVVRKVLSENGVAFFISAERYEVRPSFDGKSGDMTTVFVSATFACADTGATYTVSWMGAGSDKSDKGLYKAYTGAVKYLLMKTFLISTNDDPEVAKRVDTPDAKREGKPVLGSATRATMTSISKIIRDIELVDDVAGANALMTFEQHRERIEASATVAQNTLAKLAARLVEVKERKATAAQAADREANVVAHSAPAILSATTPAQGGVPCTPSDSVQATEHQMEAIRSGMADLESANPPLAHDLREYVRSVNATVGYTTLEAAVHVMRTLREALGVPVTLAA